VDSELGIAMGLPGCCRISRCKQFSKVAVDFLLFVSAIGVYFCSHYGLIPPAKGTFRCDDSSLRYTYTGDSVSTKVLLFFCLVPIIFIILLTELFHGPKEGVGHQLKRAGKTTARIYFNFFMGMVGNVIINDVVKSLVARPRPHFWDTCKPRMDMFNCSQNGGFIEFSPTLCSGATGGFDDAKDTIGVPNKIYDVMKSFPSGHAQVATFSAAFLIIYLQTRLGTTYSLVWKHWLQLVTASLAIFASLSRLTDHRHHGEDVLAGSIIGVLLASLTAVFMAGLVGRRQGEEEVEGDPATPTAEPENEDKREKYARQKRPSKMRLLSSMTDFGFGSVEEGDKEMSEVNPAC